MAFYDETLETIRENAIENNTTEEVEMTSLFLEYIEEDLCDTATLISCSTPDDYKKSGKFKLNAYAYSEDSHILELFVSQFFDSDKLETLTKHDVEMCHNQVVRFFNSCITNRDLLDYYKQNDPDVAEVIELIIAQYNSNQIEQLRCYILSNGAQARDNTWDVSILTEKNITQETFVIDINYIQALEEAAGNTYIDIQLKDYFQKPLECIEIVENAPGVRCYLTVVPAVILAKIYDMFKTRLLDRNVRGFLGMRPIHKAMYETIKVDSHMFFAYNNGISSTASEIDILEENGKKYISRIGNWQIVNGGQTTNTIYKAYQDGVSLENVNVFMKLSVISNENPNQEDIIANIANYANSQNKVDAADLCSNHKSLKDLDHISRKELAPINSARKQTRWYFERTKGQYSAERSRISNGQPKSAKTKKFDKENPKKQKIDKTALSIIAMSWNQHPEIASLGGIKCFKAFWSEYKDNLSIDEKYFHSIVSCAIIRESIDLVFKQLGYKGYANFVRNYVLAILSLKSDKKLDLENIWQTQLVPQSLLEIIETCTKIIFEFIKEKSEAGMDPSNEVKKIEFWDAVKTKVVAIQIPQSLLVSESEDTLTEEQKTFIEEVSARPNKLWNDLIEWGKASKNLSILERNRLKKLIATKQKGERITYDSAKQCYDLLKQGLNNGFSSKYE